MSIALQPAAGGVGFEGRQGGQAGFNFIRLRRTLNDAIFQVEFDNVAGLEGRDRPAGGGFGRNVADAGAARAAEKRPSVIKATFSPRPMPMMALVGPSISCIPGPPRGPS